MPPLIDTHAHLYSEEFDPDREAVIAACREAGVARVMLPLTSAAELERLHLTVSLAPDLFVPMIGLEPTDVGDDWEEQLETLEAELRAHPGYYKGIGEIGLDNYWPTDRREEMREAFRRQIGWAAEMQLPMSIHSRSAVKEAVEMIRAAGTERLSGVFHSFSESEEELEAILSLGEHFMVGINGIVTFKNSRLGEVIRDRLPLSRLVVETDSPYLSPVPLRGRRNDPSHMVHTVRYLSALYGCPEDELREVLLANSTEMFNLAEPFATRSA